MFRCCCILHFVIHAGSFGIRLTLQRSTIRMSVLLLVLAVSSAVIRPTVPSVFWRCWLGGRKGIRPVKKLEWWGAGVVICMERGADLHMVQLMPLPLTVSCFSKIKIGFTFLVPAHPGSLGKGPLNVCVCVCVCVCVYVCVIRPTAIDATALSDPPNWLVGRVHSNYGDHGDQVYFVPSNFCNWLSFFAVFGSRVVSMLDSAAEGPGIKSQPRRCRVTVLGKLFTTIVPLFTMQQNW